MNENELRYVLGKDLRAGDLWEGSLIRSVGDPRTVAAAVLVECVAHENPRGLAGRTVQIVTRGNVRIGCTVFDRNLYKVIRFATGARS